MVISSYCQDLCECFLIISHNLSLIHILKDVLFFRIFSDVIFMCIKRWFSSLVFSIVLMLLYGYSNQAEFTLGIWQSIAYLVGYELDVSIFLLKSLGLDPFLWLFWRIQYFYAFFLMKNGPLKRHVSNFPSLWINNSLTSLFPSPHPKHFSLRFVIEIILGILKDVYW